MHRRKVVPPALQRDAQESCRRRSRDLIVFNLQSPIAIRNLTVPRSTLNNLQIMIFGTHLDFIYFIECCWGHADAFFN